MSLFHHNNRHESNRSRQQPLSKENSASAAAGHSTTPAESGSERHSNENERPSSLFGRFRGEGMKHLSALHDDQREHDVSVRYSAVDSFLLAGEGLGVKMKGGDHFY